MEKEQEQIKSDAEKKAKQCFEMKPVPGQMTMQQAMQGKSSMIRRVIDIGS